MSRFDCIYYIQPINPLPLENIFTSLFIYSCRDQIILSLPLLLVPLYVFVSLMLGLSNTLCCCFTRSNDKLYIWLTPSPICGCLNVYICYFVIFDIYYNNISLLNATDISHMNYRLIINMLPFSHLSLHYNRKIGTVVDVII